MADFNGRGLYNWLAKREVRWCAFLYKKEDDNELQKTLTVGVVQWGGFYHDKCRRRAFARTWS